MEKNKGYVYILTNKSFREDWVKIGKTEHLAKRVKDLYTTAIPLRFDIFATIETCKYEKLEKSIHAQLDLLTHTRISKNREFFNVTPQIALKVFLSLAEVTDDAVVMRYEDNKPVEQLYPLDEMPKPKTKDADAPCKKTAARPPHLHRHRHGGDGRERMVGQLRRHRE